MDFEWKVLACHPQAPWRTSCWSCVHHKAPMRWRILVLWELQEHSRSLPSAETNLVTRLAQNKSYLHMSHQGKRPKMTEEFWLGFRFRFQTLVSCETTSRFTSSIATETVFSQSERCLILSARYTIVESERPDSNEKALVQLQWLLLTVLNNLG